MTAYYNEFDPKAAAWLRELISAGHIAPGDVDERSIADVRPADLTGYTQCHFFAGIGVWSYALRRAGWPDSRPVWTGSCPCQPFSAAGKGGGFDDERHLWPHFHYLIGQCRPGVVIGEQVASKDGLAWLDLVQADMEGEAYAFGALDFCSAGIGAPHIRQRLYWVADAAHKRVNGSGDGRSGRRDEYPDGGTTGDLEHTPGYRWEQRRPNPSGRSVIGGCGDSGVDGWMGGWVDGWREDIGQGFGLDGHSRFGGSGLANPYDARPQGWVFYGNGPGQRATGPGGVAGGLADDNSKRRDGKQVCVQPGEPRQASVEIAGGSGPDVDDRRGMEDGAGAGGNDRLRDVAPWTGPTNGHWGAVDWLFCRDGKWRPVEPGTFPLVNGAASRVGRLRGYGNAINAEAAQAFIETYIETKAVEHLRLTEVSKVAADNDMREGIFG